MSSLGTAFFFTAAIGFQAYWAIGAIRTGDDVFAAWCITVVLVATAALAAELVGRDES